MTLVTYMQHAYWEVLILFCWDIQKYLKDINMKIVNTYKQESITWFEYKTLFSFMSYIHSSKNPEGVLVRWLDNKLITKRTKDIL